MDSYFYNKDIDSIKTKLSGCEIKRIERKINHLSEESKRRAYQNYYTRKARVGKNIFLILLLTFIAFLLYTIPSRIGNNNKELKSQNFYKDITLTSLGNKAILLTDKSNKQFLLQDSLGYFDMTVKKDTLSLEVKTNILFFKKDSSDISSDLINHNDTFVLLKDSVQTFFSDTAHFFKADIKNRVVQLFLQPDHVIIGVKTNKSNLEFYTLHLLIFLIICACCYFALMFFGINTKNCIYNYEKQCRISEKIDELMDMTNAKDSAIVSKAKEIIQEGNDETTDKKTTKTDDSDNGGTESEDSNGKKPTECNILKFLQSFRNRFI